MSIIFEIINPKNSNTTEKLMNRAKAILAVFFSFNPLMPCIKPIIAITPANNMGNPTSKAEMSELPFLLRIMVEKAIVIKRSTITPFLNDFSMFVRVSFI